MKNYRPLQRYREVKDWGAIQRALEAIYRWSKQFGQPDFANLVQSILVAYVTIQDEGIALPQQPAINFIGASVVAVDDPANNRTNVTITGYTPQPDNRIAWWLGGIITGTGPGLRTDGTLITVDKTSGTGAAGAAFDFYHPQSSGSPTWAANSVWRWRMGSGTFDVGDEGLSWQATNNTNTVGNIVAVGRYDNAVNQVVLGSYEFGQTQIRSDADINLKIAGFIEMSIRHAGTTGWFFPNDSQPSYNIGIDARTTSPARAFLIKGQDLSTTSGTAGSLTVMPGGPSGAINGGTTTAGAGVYAGGDCSLGSGNTNRVGGQCTSRGGDVTVGSGNRIGGDYVTRAGNGSTSGGVWRCQDPAGTDVIRIPAAGTVEILQGGTKRIEANGTGLGFFNVAPVAQQADMVALTDSTGGTANNTLVDVTTAGLADPVKCNDNFADLAAKVNTIRTVLRNLGFMA